MGERGAEAILPLSRGPNGQLGIASNGTGGGSPVTVHIQTADAESFRRSESQVAAALARAVAREGAAVPKAFVRARAVDGKLQLLLGRPVSLRPW